MKTLGFILPIACLLLLFSCKKSDNKGAPDLNTVKPLATEKGAVAGATRTYVIDSKGGTVVSDDGRITLTIPAGAVPAAITVGITPVKNNVPLGLGNGYRLTPEGTQFAKPVTISFNYANVPLNGAIQDFLWITTQNADGTWSANTASEVDTINKKVTVTTTHFSDWALGRFVDFTLNPASATLKVNESVQLSVSGFLKSDGPESLRPLAPIGSELAPIDQVMALLEKTQQYKEFKISGWALNGKKAPVSNNFGSLETNDRMAEYKAPSARPSPNVVAVSASLDAWQANGKKQGYMLVSNIAIIDTDYYLSILVDDKEYYYTQYLPPNIPPDVNNLHAVGAGIAALSNSLEIRAGYSSASTGLVEGGFHINFTNPVPGRRSFKCPYTEPGETDEIEFTALPTSTTYLFTYVTRYYNENDRCQSDYKCSDISFTLLSYDGPGKPAKGSFSGYIYEDPKSFEQSCKSSVKHFITGEFNLFVNNN